MAVDTPEKLEEKVAGKNCIYVTVEDPENKISQIKTQIKEIKKLELTRENEDGTKQYVIESDENIDLRKRLFTELAKEDITIFEMKKADTTLEDAFMQLIDSKEETIVKENKETKNLEKQPTESKEDLEEKSNDSEENNVEENKTEEGGQE